MLSRLVIAFLSRSKCLLISWLQSQSAVSLEPKKRQSVTIFTLFPFAMQYRNLRLQNDVGFLGRKLIIFFDRKDHIIPILTEIISSLLERPLENLGVYGEFAFLNFFFFFSRFPRVPSQPRSR